MKKILIAGIIYSTALLLTGCYTQLAVSDSEPEYSGPIIIIIEDPLPPPPLPDPPTYNQPEQKEKIRNPEPPPSTKDNGRDKIRNTGGRNNQGNRNRR